MPWKATMAPTADPAKALVEQYVWPLKDRRRERTERENGERERRERTERERKRDGVQLCGVYGERTSEKRTNARTKV